MVTFWQERLTGKKRLMNNTVNYPRGSGRLLKEASGIENSPELTLTPPPDTKALRRNQQLEYGEQWTYFNQVNTRLCPNALTRGYFVALPESPGADLIYAVPNSNVAGQAVGVKLVRSGLRKGYPDINIDVARTCNGHHYHGLRIEMKQPQGVLSNVAKEQAHWHEKLRDQGYRVCVCFGWREAWAVTCDYLGWEDV